MYCKFFLLAVVTLLAWPVGLSAQSTELPPVEIVSPRPAFPALAPRGADRSLQSDLSRPTASKTMATPTVTVASSLAVVLGLFAAMVWFTRRLGGNTGANRALSKDALEVLGSSTIEPRVKVSLLRVGSRVVVLAHTASGVQPISEITDTDEVQRLIASCRGDSTHSFAAELKAIEKEAYSPGFVDTATSSPRRRSRGLFASA